MVEDARFEDGGERPLKLKAEDAEDLRVLSALAQDAVLPSSEMSWSPSKRRFALLVNRFRWEDKERAAIARRPVERVQAMLVFDDVRKVRSTGIDRADNDLILSLLAVDFEPAEDGAGSLVLTLAGDGAIALDVECINVLMQDVTRPYLAPSGKAPEHDA